MAQHQMTGESLDLATQKALSLAYDVATAPDTTDSQLPVTVATTADELGVTDGWVIEQLRDIATTAADGVSVFNKDGDYAGTVPQLAAATAALKLLAQIRGMLVDRSETEHTGGIDIRIVGVNPENLT